MIEHHFLILGIALVLGLYLAWNIGANDVANAMGTSVGSGALTLKNALIIAAILEFCGAFFVGSHVSETIQSGLINEGIFINSPKVLVLGMLASLLATGVWLQIASYYGWPVSTTHCIIGAVVGFGLIIGGFEAVEWDNLSFIASSWIISPIIGGVISYIIFTILRRKVFYTHDPVSATKKLAPILVFFVFSILTSVTLFKGLSNVNLDLHFSASLGISVSIGLLAAFIAYLLLKKVKPPQREVKNELIKDLQSQISLGKVLKHLQRLRANSEGDIQEEAIELFSRASDLSKKLESISSPVEASEYALVEKIFSYLQIISACCMAFAHGANDVANAIGPLATIFSIVENNTVIMSAEIPSWILALGGIGIVIGLATWGWRVIETIGKKLTELTPSRGFAAEFGAAFTILFASKLGLPISTTHTLVGSVLGVGLARGIGALNLSMIREIFLSWVVTLPAGAILSVIFYYLFTLMF
jgi:PiT family inorganic phosphate transporter